MINNNPSKKLSLSTQANYMENNFDGLKDSNQICNFTFHDVEQLDSLISSQQYEKVCNFFKNNDQLGLFINYFAGFLNYTKKKIILDQNILTNVLSYLIFHDIEILTNFTPLAINLLTGGTKRAFIPSKTQQIIAMRHFLHFFDEKWFDIKYTDNDTLIIAIFKSMTSTDDIVYNIFLDSIVKKIPLNSKYIPYFIEILFYTPINSPMQFKFADALTRKCPNNPPFYSILFFMKHSITGIFTRISHHYLIPLILDFYNKFDVVRVTIWHYLCRLVQFCITVECLKKQQKTMNNKIKSSKTLNYSASQPSAPFYNSLDNSVFNQNSSSNEFLFLHPSLRTDKSNLSENDFRLNDTSSSNENLSSDETALNQSDSSFDYMEGAFDDLDAYNDIVSDIMELLHILYALHIPLLCRTIYMEIRCAQLGFYFFKKETFDESYIKLTVFEINQARSIELPKPAVKLTSTKSEDIQKQKEIYYIQNYLYDKQLLKDFYRIRPREINLKRLLDFPYSVIPLKKGVKKIRPPITKTNQNAKQNTFCCTPLSSTLYNIATKKTASALESKSSTKRCPQSNSFVVRSSPIMRLKQYFSKESTSASAE